jgi:hypothetical protein
VVRLIGVRRGSLPRRTCVQSLTLNSVKGKKHHKKTREVSPVTMLTDELNAVRRDLRRTIRAYTARLELDLADSVAAVNHHKGGEDLSRERLHDIRDLTIMMRKRKLKPEKGRRKDIRKLDSLIRDLQSIARPNALARSD